MTAPHPPYRPQPYYPPRPGPWPQGPNQPGPWGPPHQQAPWGPPPKKSGLPPWGVAVIIVVALTLLAGILLAAGSSDGTTRAGGQRPGVGTGQQQSGPGDSDCPGGSLEGCYTESQMPEFLRQAITFVHGFSDDRYAGRMPHPADYRLIGSGQKAQSACGALDSMTYAYCPADDSVYIGQRQLWQFYSGIGDAAAVVGLAHEYGHHIQQVAGVPDDRSARNQVVHENQADCIAGAFIGWADEKGYLEDGDTRDIEGLVRAIASSEDDPGRDHGTLQERAASLSTGVRDGLPGCSTFYPDTPVHTN